MIPWNLIKYYQLNYLDVEPWCNGLWMKLKYKHIYSLTPRNLIRYLLRDQLPLLHALWMELYTSTYVKMDWVFGLGCKYVSKCLHCLGFQRFSTILECSANSYTLLILYHVDMVIARTSEGWVTLNRSNIEMEDNKAANWKSYLNYSVDNRNITSLNNVQKLLLEHPI